MATAWRDLLIDRLGPAVRDVGFSAAIAGGAVVLTPETVALEPEEHEGRLMLFGRWRDVRVRWEFVARDGGWVVTLRLNADHPLECRALTSLRLTYAPGGPLADAWVPTYGDDIARTGLLRLAELGPQTERGKLLRGLFRDAHTECLFAGNLLPQQHLHEHTLTAAGDDAVELVSTTRYPEGFEAQTELQSEATWVCTTQPPPRALATWQAFVPAMSPCPSPPVGWNSWDYYYSTVSLADLEENLAAIRDDPVLAETITTVVIDMGWEHAMGEWQPNYRWPGGLERAAQVIREAGFIPGIWTAPLLIGSLSVPALRQPEMLVQNPHGDPQAGWGGFLLDPTHPHARTFLRELYTRLARAGFRFFKIDYLSPLLEVERFHDRHVGPYEALAELIWLVRECVGHDAHLLGCSLPVECGPGLVDSGRTGIDIHNQWSHVTWAIEYLIRLCGFHGRVWLNDPDFLVVRGSETSTEAEINVTNPAAHAPNPGRWRRGPVFNAQEARAWASVVAMSGGSVFLSDRLTRLNDLGRWVIGKVIRPTGVAAMPLDLGDEQYPARWLQVLDDELRLTVINVADEPRWLPVDFAALGLVAPEQVRELWTEADCQVIDGVLTAPLAAHDAAVFRWPRQDPWQVR